MLHKLLVEAILVGLATVVVGYIAAPIAGAVTYVPLPQICKTWNKNYAMELSLFLTGFMLHLVAEFSGVNKWYCKNGFACRR
jgi:hypothetical protein